MACSALMFTSIPLLTKRLNGPVIDQSTTQSVPLSPGPSSLQLALDTSDPDNLVAQLRALRHDQLNNLSIEIDELTPAAETVHTSCPEKRGRPRSQVLHTVDGLVLGVPRCRHLLLEVSRSQHT